MATLRTDARGPAVELPESVRIPVAPDAPLVYELGHDAYRQSEDTWAEAGSPRATVRLGAKGDQLAITIDVHKPSLVFRPADAPDPGLDNEFPDIHSDGVQLHIWPDAAGQPVAWLAVPEERSQAVRVHVADGARRDVELAATWHRTPDGYTVELRVPRDLVESARDGAVAMQVVINEMAPGRERRRGQLVLSGGAGEHVYLRGDRESPAHALRFRIARG